MQHCWHRSPEDPYGAEVCCRCGGRRCTVGVWPMQGGEGHGARLPGAKGLTPLVSAGVDPDLCREAEAFA